ncbi:anhydro-N-acetylmuramic acid kinase [Coxiella endosymbiont of Ornithodoros amblus]
MAVLPISPLLPRDPGKSTISFDTGPGNTLLDAWCLMNLNKDYDD